MEELPATPRHAMPVQHRQPRAMSSNFGTDYCGELPEPDDLGRRKARRCGQVESDRRASALELFLNFAEGKMGPVALV